AKAGGHASARGSQRTAFILILLGGAAWGLRESSTRSALEAGKRWISQGRIAEAETILKRAGERDPEDPDPPAILSELYLSRVAGRPDLRVRGESWARREVELRPRRAYGHYVLALYRLAAGDRGEAWVEISRARLLFPSRELYIKEEARLRELLTVKEGDGSDARR